jgi:hypothetical protein
MFGPPLEIVGFARHLFPVLHIPAMIHHAVLCVREAEAPDDNLLATRFGLWK